MENLQTAVHAALKAWNKLAGTPTNLLEDLLLVRQEKANVVGDNPTTRRLTTNRVLHKGIESLQKQDPVAAQLLSRRFMDGDTLLMTAHRLQLSEDQAKRRQREAIQQLAQILWEQETAVRQAHLHHFQNQLPPSGYHQLFGTQDKLGELVTLLCNPTAPWVIAIVGIGGIGKTSLADAAVRSVIPHFVYEQLAWLRVSPQDEGNIADNILTELAANLCLDLPSSATAVQRNQRLRAVLKATPHLVVIDNIETAVGIDHLLEKLNDFAHPSRFLLTTRVRLPAVATAYNLLLGELSYTAAADLVRYQAQNIGVQELVQAANSDIEHIFEATGGNPLAIKLIVGLAAVLPLSHILADLKAAHLTEIEQMYRHIYWQAWHNLSANAQALLEMMPLASEIGLKPEQMQVMWNIEQPTLWAAITELVNRSLLEVRGTTWERRYGLHRLTESFLQTEIIHLPEGW